MQRYSELEQRFRIPTQFLSRTEQLESSGNVRAYHPVSKAAGPFQFIPSTAKQYGLTDPYNRDLAAEAAARLASDNASVLRNRLGRDPSAAELYLAHQQGASGAAALLANPNAPAASIVGEKAVTLNRGRPDMTAGEFASMWLNKFEGNANKPTVTPMDPSALSAATPTPGTQTTGTMTDPSKIVMSKEDGLLGGLNDISSLIAPLIREKQLQDLQQQRRMQDVDLGPGIGGGRFVPLTGFRGLI
jgi:hypothetical protein